MTTSDVIQLIMVIAFVIFELLKIVIELANKK